jgi:hypothetical protein
MEGRRPSPVGAILSNTPKRGSFDGELSDLFPPCHDHSPRIDQLLLQLQRNELVREQGACVLVGRVLMRGWGRLLGRWRLARSAHVRIGGGEL